MPDGFHMDADLVCSSRLQQEADEREVGVLVVCDGLIMGHGSLTPLRIADALNGRAVFSGDRKVNGAGVSCLSGNDSGVFPVDRMILHGLRENTGAVGIFCQKYKPGGIPVQTVHGAEYERCLLIPVIPGDRVCQRVLVMSLRRVDRHSGRFVDHEDMFVFIDRQRDPQEPERSVQKLFSL